MAHPITVTVLTIFLVVELITDQLPKTPSRRTPPQFTTRLIMGAFSGAEFLAAASHHTFIGLGAGMIGAVVGALGGAAGRAQASPRPTADVTGRWRSAKTSSRSAAGVPDCLPRQPRPDRLNRVLWRFDAIIVGAGQAGPPLAGRLTDAGQTVAVIERKLVGGTCVNTGCIPTKTLVASAHAAHLARRGAEFGVGTGQVTVDMAKVKARKDGSCSNDRHGVESWLDGMDGLHGGPRATRVSRTRTRCASATSCWRPTGSSSTSAAARWCPTCRDWRTSTT